MATFSLFDDFSEQLAKGVHQFGTHTFKLFLCNALNAPAGTETGVAGLTQISQTNLSGGANPTITLSVSDATDTVISADEEVLTASGGSVGPFRYYGIYNETATSPADALVCWWDHGSEVTLSDGDTFTIKFNNAATGGTILTIGQGTIV